MVHEGRSCDIAQGARSSLKVALKYRINSLKTHGFEN